MGLTDDLRSTEILIGRIHAGKAPAVENGSTLQRDFERAVRRIRENFARERDVAAKLPLNDHKAFVRAAAAFQRRINRDFSDVSPAALALKGLKTKDLKKAFGRAPACQDLPR